MKLPYWIQKILRREPVKPCTPSRSTKETFLEYLNKPSVENFLRCSTESGRIRSLSAVFE